MRLILCFAKKMVPAYYVDYMWGFSNLLDPISCSAKPPYGWELQDAFHKPHRWREETLALGILPKCNTVSRSKSPAMGWKWVEDVAGSRDNLAVSSSSIFWFTSSRCGSLSSPPDLLSTPWPHLDRFASHIRRSCSFVVPCLGCCI